MPNLHNVLADVESQMFPNREYRLEIDYYSEETHRWIVWLHRRNKTARLEFIIHEDPINPEDTDVVGSVLEYDGISRQIVGLVMDSIMERL